MPENPRIPARLPAPEEMVPWWHAWMPENRPAWQRYLLAIVLTLLAFGLQRLLFSAGGNRFALFYITVVLSAWFGGYGPAFLALALAALISGWVLAPIGIRPPLTIEGNSIVVAVFLVTGVFLIAACQAAHRANRRLRIGLENLKAEVERRADALAAQHAAETELDGVFRLAGAGMAITEVTTGRFLRVNPELCQMLGYTDEEMLKMTYLDATPAPDREWTAEQLARFARGETRFLHLENRVLRKNWDVLWVDAIGTELPATHERPRRMVIILLDTTERIVAQRRLQEADRRKDEFLAMLSHELRNPLGAIRQALRLTEQEPDAATRQWARDVVERQTAQLSRMVDDLLDVARFHAGKISVHLAPIDLAGVLDRAAQLIAALLSERGHAFSADYPRDLWVMGDAARLEQVVVNLLTNAAKYTDWGGRIELRAGAQIHEIVVEVRDNGQGIASEKITEMFEAFVQGERSLARPEGGLGLGLAIVRQLVDLHHGRITAESPGVGQGSTFTLTLPQIAKPLSPTAPAPAAPAKVSLVGQRILVVDDHQDAARSLARLLERRGAEVAVLHDGLSALHEATAFAPDTILLDLGLPGLDGYEVARQLRARGAAFRLIAVSGYGTDQDRERSAAAGFDAHLLKPVDFDALCARLDLARKA